MPNPVQELEHQNRVLAIKLRHAINALEALAAALPACGMGALAAALQDLLVNLKKDAP